MVMASNTPEPCRTMNGAITFAAMKKPRIASEFHAISFSRSAAPRDRLSGRRTSRRETDRASRGRLRSTEGLGVSSFSSSALRSLARGGLDFDFHARVQQTRAEHGGSRSHSTEVPTKHRAACFEVGGVRHDVSDANDVR